MPTKPQHNSTLYTNNNPSSIRSIRQSIMQLRFTMFYPYFLVLSVVKNNSFPSSNSL